MDAAWLSNTLAEPNGNPEKMQVFPSTLLSTNVDNHRGPSWNTLPLEARQMIMTCFIDICITEEPSYGDGYILKMLERPGNQAIVYQMVEETKYRAKNNPLCGTLKWFFKDTEDHMTCGAIEMPSKFELYHRLLPLRVASHVSELSILESQIRLEATTPRGLQ